MFDGLNLEENLMKHLQSGGTGPAFRFWLDHTMYSSLAILDQVDPAMTAAS